MNLAPSDRLHSAPSVSLLAWLAYRLNRRNNFGWSPMVIALSWGGGSDRDGLFINIAFEVWNRRKYPIVIRSIELNYEGITLVPTENYVPGEWYVPRWRTSCIRRERAERIEPNSHVEISVRQTIEDVSSLDATISETPTISVRYFDPRLGRIARLAAKESWQTDRRWLGVWGATQKMFRR